MNQQLDYDQIQEQPTLDDALAEMTADGDNIPGPTVMYGLSGLSSADIAKLEPAWRELDPTYRQILMQMLVDVSESNFELNYDAIGWANLHAEQPEVRQAAIEVLWEDESLRLMNELMRIAETDEAVNVRAEAVKTLGRFVLLGELDDLPQEDTIRAQELLLRIVSDVDEAVNVRRYALESIANCTRAEVATRIKDAYGTDNIDLRTSAVVAMGRTCDSKQWETIVLNELGSRDETMRLQAVRAAGELQLTEAVPHLIPLLDEGNRDLQESLIWAFGEIGGKEATRTLEALAEHAEEIEDDDLLALIDDAVGNASLASSDLMMLDFSDYEDGDTNTSTA